MKIIANNYKPNEIIKIIREWSEKTQQEFAENLGKNKNTIQSWELGRNKMTLNTLMEIAKKENLIITIERK
mgnify:FL=1